MAKIDIRRLSLKLFDLIPIIFAAFISAGFVWHFTASKTPFILSFAGAFIYQLILFAVFDFAKKPKNKFVFAIYIIAIFMITPALSEVYEMIMLPLADEQMSNIMIMDWFFGAESYTLYNPGFCFQLLMYISLPIGAAIYFYTKVYLRISVLFLVAIFPPIIYAKDYESYPPQFCAILMILFFLTVIYCKYLKTTNNKKSVAQSFHFPVSVLSFIAAAIFVAIIIPKPDIEDKRQAFDEFTQGRFSSQYGRITDNFTNTSNGNNSSNTSNRTLCIVQVDELLNLKTQCYYYYDDSDDLWLPLDEDAKLMKLDRYYMRIDASEKFESNIEMYNPLLLMEDIIFACNKDNDFAEEYNLQSLIGKNTDMGNYEKYLTYQSVNQYFCPSYFLTPENTFNIKISANSTRTEIIKTDSGVLYPIYEPENGLLCYQPGQKVTFSYISPHFIYDNRAQSILRGLCYEEYGEFLNDLTAITNSDIANDAYEEYMQQNEIYKEESERVFSRDIRNLADEITDGLYSDYEKAKAVEQFFYEQGYEYDVDYVCPEGENITDFIFNEKKGSCYHYATAMTLLCRSAGLNARYCEGFSYSELTENYGNSGNAYIIDESCSHAFCEVFISGYGWMRFEPTVPDNSIAGGSAQIAFTVLIMLIIAVALAFIFTKYIYPVLEKMYLKKLARTKQNDKLCQYIMNSIKKATNSTSADATFEVVEKAHALSDMDISEFGYIFNKGIYSDNSLDLNEANKIIDTLFVFRKNCVIKRRQMKKIAKMQRKLKYI